MADLSTPEGREEMRQFIAAHNANLEALGVQGESFMLLTAELLTLLDLADAGEWLRDAVELCIAGGFLGREKFGEALSVLPSPARAAATTKGE